MGCAGGAGDGGTESLGSWGPCCASEEDALSDVLGDKSNFYRWGSGAEKAVPQKGNHAKS